MTPNDLTALARGHVLQAGNRLFQQKGDKILVWQPGFTSRMSMDDFLQLYGMLDFAIRETEAGIDEEKDRAYYAWREEHQ